MSGELIVTLLVAVLTGSGTAIVTGYYTRPKLNAEAGKAGAEGEVAVSGDAREWAKLFAQQKIDADKRAELAIEKATAANEHADQLETKYDDLQAQHLKLVLYTRQLRKEMELHGWTPPAPPPDLLSSL